MSPPPPPRHAHSEVCVRAAILGQIAIMLGQKSGSEVVGAFLWGEDIACCRDQEYTADEFAQRKELKKTFQGSMRGA